MISYGVTVNNDSVLRSVFYKYLHPKEVHIGEGVLVPDIARKKVRIIINLMYYLIDIFALHIHMLYLYAFIRPFIYLLIYLLFVVAKNVEFDKPWHGKDERSLEC
jgi:hypothetical protein